MESQELILGAGILDLDCQKVFNMFRRKYIFLGVGLFISLLVFGICFRTKSPASSFTSAKWMVAGPRERGDMVKDLLANRRDSLTDTQSVTKLLGRPDKQTQNEWTYRVDMGHKLGSSPWSYRLTVKLQNERVQTILLLD
jgi:hypothetical protein